MREKALNWESDVLVSTLPRCNFGKTISLSLRHKIFCQTGGESDFGSNHLLAL